MSTKNEPEKIATPLIEPSVPVSPIPTAPLPNADDGPPEAPSDEYVPALPDAWPTPKLPPEEPAEASDSEPIDIPDKPIETTEVPPEPDKPADNIGSANFPAYLGRDFMKVHSMIRREIWHGIIARRQIVGVIGEQKIGKSEFLASMWYSMWMPRPLTTIGWPGEEDPEFLGIKLTRVWKILLTEESSITLYPKYFPFLNGTFEGLIVVSRTDIKPDMKWEDILIEVGMLIDRERARGHDIGVVEVDSFANWARITNENDQAQMYAAMNPVRRIAESKDVTVTLVHHNNKLGGFRGSTAWACECDVLLPFARGVCPEEEIKKMTETRRHITISGRISAGTPRYINCELRIHEYE
jgi:hypothetical protein